MGVWLGGGIVTVGGITFGSSGIAGYHYTGSGMSFGLLSVLLLFALPSRSRYEAAGLRR